jgi:hypothetical protein
MNTLSCMRPLSGLTGFRRFAGLAGLAVAGLLSACGGGGGSNVDSMVAAVQPAGNVVPEAATASAEAFSAFAARLPTDDVGEPLSVAMLNPPTSDTAEPIDVK